MYCGTGNLSTLDVLQINSLNADATCFCDKYHHGVACQLGFCPEANGAPCNNRGHPSFGQGLLINTTQTVSDLGTPCTPTCLPGFQSCGATCQHAGKCPSLELDKRSIAA